MTKTAMRKKIEQSQFNDIICEHSEWLYDKSKGKKACFQNCDLSGMQFVGDRLVEIDFSNADLTDCVFDWSNLNRSCFYASRLIRSKFLSCMLTEANFAYAGMRETNLKHCDLTGSNFNYTDLWSSNLEDSHLVNCSFIGSNLLECNLKNTKLGSPTLLLLADWGELSDELTKLAMAFDASCHHNKTLFDAWSESGRCPYMSCSYERACKFKEKRYLWDAEIKAPGALELMIKIIQEKCVDSDWHNKD